jgi:hypothetical protein
MLLAKALMPVAEVAKMPVPNNPSFKKSFLSILIIFVDTKIRWPKSHLQYGTLRKVDKVGYVY